MAGEKVSTRVEVVRPGPIAGFYVSLRRRVAALDWRALFGPSKEKPVAAVSGRREIEDLAASILPTYDGVGPNFIAYAHFWEWVYQYPILGLFVRPVVRWLQPYFFRDLKNSQVAEYQLLFQELSKLKPSWKWVGVTRLGTILNVLGSIAIIGGFLIALPLLLIVLPTLIRLINK